MNPHHGKMLDTFLLLGLRGLIQSGLDKAASILENLPLPKVISQSQDVKLWGCLEDCFRVFTRVFLGSL